MKSRDRGSGHEGQVRLPCPPWSGRLQPGHRGQKQKATTPRWREDTSQAPCRNHLHAMADACCSDVRALPGAAGALSSQGGPNTPLALLLGAGRNVRTHAVVICPGRFPSASGSGSRHFIYKNDGARASCRCRDRMRLRFSALKIWSLYGCCHKPNWPHSLEGAERSRGPSGSTEAS